MSRSLSAHANALVCLAVVLPLGLPATAIGQTEPASPSASAISSAYLARLMEQSPDILEPYLIHLLAISDEKCEEARKASGIPGLRSLEGALDIRLEKELTRLEEARRRFRANPNGENTHRLKSDELGTAAALFMYAEVSECIADRERQIIAGEPSGWEGKLEAIWTGTCSADSEELHPDETGRFLLMLHPDGSIDGFLYPLDSTVGIELIGAHNPEEGSFVVQRDPEGELMRSTRIDLRGQKVSPEAGGTASSWTGAIDLNGSFEGYGNWRCSGTWGSG